MHFERHIYIWNENFFKIPVKLGDEKNQLLNEKKIKLIEDTEDLGIDYINISFPENRFRIKFDENNFVSQIWFNTDCEFLIDNQNVLGEIMLNHKEVFSERYEYIEPHKIEETKKTNDILFISLGDGIVRLVGVLRYELRKIKN